MAGLKEIRGRIVTVKTTMQVTSAMKMVSAAKLVKAQNVLLSSRPYALKLTELLSHLLMEEETRENFPYLETKTRDTKNVLLVIVTSNRGLCGAFNSSIVKAAVEQINEKYKGKNVDIISIGKSGGKLLKSRKLETLSQHNDIFNDLSFESLKELSVQFTEDYLNGKYDKIEFAYTNFVSAGRLEVTFENFLPLIPKEESEDTYTNINYIYEPGKKEILYDLIPKALQMHAYLVLLNSSTSEHAARMQAMQQATDNAKNLLRDLTLSYNKARQTAITNEILEITGGAEALKNA